MTSAGRFDNNCFPNPYFSPHDVSIDDGKVMIDLSRGSPSPTPSDSSLFSGDESEDDTLPPLVTPDPSEDGGSDIAEDDYGDDYDEPAYADAEENLAPPDPSGPDLLYTVANVFSQVLRLFDDDLVAANLRSMFGGSELRYEYPPIEHWYARLEDGSYALRPHLALLAMTHLRNLAGLISAVLNAEIVDIHGFEPGACEVSVPYAATDECRVVFPSILLLLSGRWDIRHRRYSLEEKVKKHVKDILFTLRFAIALLGKIAACTLFLGEHSVCNPGAGIGMDQEEFLERISVQARVIRQVELWLDPLLRGGSSIRAADTACGRLLCPQGFSEFVVFEDDEKASIIPLHHEGHEGMTSRLYTRVEELPQILFARGFGH